VFICNSFPPTLKLQDISIISVTFSILAVILFTKWNTWRHLYVKYNCCVPYILFICIHQSHYMSIKIFSGIWLFHMILSINGHSLGICNNNKIAGTILSLLLVVRFSNSSTDCPFVSRSVFVFIWGGIHSKASFLHEKKKSLHILSINNNQCHTYSVYPSELEIKDTTKCSTSASYLIYYWNWILTAN
jgi:hypothetical protein